MTLRYIDVCSGISAPTAAWEPLGWKALCFAEIEPAPRSVLAHHYPDTPLRGDFTEIEGNEYGPVDLLVGGTPCQSFSVAGLRGGLADKRGNLALEFLKLASRARPRWVVWENVPGVFSSLSHDAPDFSPPDIDLDAGDGPADGEEVVVEDSYDADESHAFACFLAGLQELGYGTAYRVLDAQYAGVPQRRRRVFAVGYLGDWRRAAAVLFERHGLSGHPAPRREARTGVAALTANGVGTCGADDNQGQAGHLIASTGQTSHCLNAGGMGRQDYETETLIAHSLRGEGFDASEDGTGHGTPLVPVAIQERAVSENPGAGPDGAGFRTDGQAYTLEARSVPQAVCFDDPRRFTGTHGGFEHGGIHPTLESTNPKQIVCFSAKDHGADAMHDLSPTLRAGGHSGSHANAGVMPAVALMENQRAEIRLSGAVDALTRGGGKPSQGYAATFNGSAVRRLTPRECERLQGFPDDFTLVPHRNKPMADGPRYKMLGNSMAVPVLRWIGERIQAVEALALARAA